MTYDNTNRGTLAKNARKTEDKHPDITGSINVDGKDYWLNGWQKSKDGSTFYSLSVKAKEARSAKSYSADKTQRRVPAATPTFDTTGYSPADDDAPY